MLQKFKSRKFLLALLANIVGIVTLICGAAIGEHVSTIVGSIITIFSTLGYIKVEGDIDKQKKK